MRQTWGVSWFSLNNLQRICTLKWHFEFDIHLWLSKAVTLPVFRGNGRPEDLVNKDWPDRVPRDVCHQDGLGSQGLAEESGAHALSVFHSAMTGAWLDCASATHYIVAPSFLWCAAFKRLYSLWWTTFKVSSSYYVFLSFAKAVLVLGPCHFCELCTSLERLRVDVET